MTEVQQLEEVVREHTKLIREQHCILKTLLNHIEADLLTSSEAADFLSMSTKTLQKKRDRGEIIATWKERRPMYRRSDLVKYLDGAR